MENYIITAIIIPRQIVYYDGEKFVPGIENAKRYTCADAVQEAAYLEASDPTARVINVGPAREQPRFH